MTQQKLAVFDIDGTLVRWQLYHAVANELAKRGFLGTDALQKMHQARMVWKRRTHSEAFREYEQEVVALYNLALATLQLSDYEAAIDHVLNEYKDQVFTYTRDLAKNLKTQGYTLLAISGSPQEIVTKLAAYYGFDHAIGAVFEHTGTVFTGIFTTPVHNKDIVLQQFAKTHKISLKGSIAVGDSESDIPMLGMVDTQIAFNPTRGLYTEAKAKGWKIVIERKNMVYELESRDGTYVLA